MSFLPRPNQKADDLNKSAATLKAGLAYLRSEVLVLRSGAGITLIEKSHNTELLKQAARLLGPTFNPQTIRTAALRGTRKPTAGETGVEVSAVSNHTFSKSQLDGLCAQVVGSGADVCLVRVIGANLHSLTITGLGFPNGINVQQILLAAISSATGLSETSRGIVINFVGAY